MILIHREFYWLSLGTCYLSSYSKMILFNVARAQSRCVSFLMYVWLFTKREVYFPVVYKQAKK